MHWTDIKSSMTTLVSRYLLTQTEEDSLELCQPLHVISGINTWTSLFLHQVEIKACLCSCLEEEDSLSSARRQLYNIFFA